MAFGADDLIRVHNHGVKHETTQSPRRLESVLGRSIIRGPYWHHKWPVSADFADALTDALGGPLLAVSLEYAEFEKRP